MVTFRFAGWMMDLNDRATQAHGDSIQWFPEFHQSEHVLQDVLICLAGEVGEVCNLVKKYVRGSITQEELLRELPEEVIDIQTYLFNLMGHIHNRMAPIDWEEAYDRKRRYNQSRFGTGSSSGHD